MAITFNQIPQNFTPSDNDLMFVFTSTMSAQVNFEFKVEVLVNSSIVSQELIFPIEGGTAYFNASDTVKSLFSIPNIPTDISTDQDLLVSADVLKNIQIRVTERYGSPIADQALANSSARDVFKASLDTEDWVDYLGTAYTISTVTPAKFMTNVPRGEAYYIDDTKSNYITFFNGATQLIGVVMRTYDASGALIDNKTVNFGSKTKAVYNLNTSLSKWVDETSIDTTDAVTYSVQVLIAGVAASEEFKYTILQPCVTDRTVYFINKLGGLDVWMFNLSKKIAREFKRNTFTKRFGQLNGTSFDYDKFIGAEQNYHNKSTASIDLLSDWNSPDIQGWLVRELLESPLVWMEDVSDNKERIVLTNANENEPQDKYVELVQLELSFRKSLQSKSVVY